MGKSITLITAIALVCALAMAGGEATAQTNDTAKVHSGAQAEPYVAEQADAGDLRKKKCPIIIRDPLCDEDDDDIRSPEATSAAAETTVRFAFRATQRADWRREAATVDYR